MRPISANSVKSLVHHSSVIVADNSGGKEAEIISVIGHKTRLRQQINCGIADMVNVVIKKGKPEIRKKVERAIIVRVAKEYRRKSGERIKFEDNAVVLVDDKGIPKGSEIKGAIAKEVGEKWPKVAGIASIIV